MISAAIILACALFSLSSPGLEIATNAQATADQKRIEFLQQNFSRFVPVQFKKDTNSLAAIQFLHSRDSLFELDGTNYFGFKFTAPPWLDGDFEWMFLRDKTQTTRDYTSGRFDWYIIPETGRSKGFQDYMPDRVSRYPQLHARFPYTHSMIIQSLSSDRLQPGKTYAIWFGFSTNLDLPDYAFSITIDSDRGAQEFGALPLR